MYVLEFGSPKYMFKNLDENQWKKFQLQKLKNKSFLATELRKKTKRILGHKY
jgi:hypothetical protein